MKRTSKLLEEASRFLPRFNELVESRLLLDQARQIRTGTE